MLRRAGGSRGGQKQVVHCLESWGLKKTDERTFHWFLVRELTRLMNIGGENRGYSYKVKIKPYDIGGAMMVTSDDGPYSYT